MSTKDIEYVRRGFNVRRYHVMTVHKQDTVGQHSAGVAAIGLILTDGTASKNFLVAALYHDIHEQITGDVPATAKWEYPELAAALALAERKCELEFGFAMPSLNPEEALLLKTCDMLDLCFKCREEIDLGNLSCIEVLNRGVAYLGNHYNVHSAADIVRYPWAKKIHEILCKLVTVRKVAGLVYEY